MDGNEELLRLLQVEAKEDNWLGVCRILITFPEFTSDLNRSLSPADCRQELSGVSPLFAAYHGKLTLPVRVLLAARADPFLEHPNPNKRGQTWTLKAAAKSGNDQETIEMLRGLKPVSGLNDWEALPDSPPGQRATSQTDQAAGTVAEEHSVIDNAASAAKWMLEELHLHAQEAVRSSGGAQGTPASLRRSSV
eukprot:5553367-Prymnesium_polylepis.1